MKDGFQFDVLWNDNDLFEIRISAWSRTFGGVADVYVPIGGLREAAESLAGFPRNSQDDREVQFGKFGSGWGGGAFNIRLYCQDTAGHAVAESRIESEYDGKGKAQSVLLMAPIEAAAVDRFVEDLRRLETERRGSAFLAISS